MTREQKFYSALMASVGALALSVTHAYAWQSPTEHKYLTDPLEICDKGTFYVGGNPKITPFASGATPQGQRQIIINQMYVQFQTPMKAKSWPLIMVHGSGYSGSAVEGTAGGNEGWNDYVVRNGIPSYVVDQPGRGRSGFDHTPIHEAVYLINQGNIAGALALLPGGGTLPAFGFSHEGTAGWASWFGHFVPPAPSGDRFDESVTASTMVRNGAPGDILCTTEPAHCKQLGRLPMEPEAPWAVDQAIKSRTGKGAPSGVGTVTPDNAQVATNAAYLALDAYKFDLPNTENFLPGSTCPTCSNPAINATNTWTPIALAELVEGIGGAIVATHSQAGSIGHHMTRILKQHGNLALLKGLITIEGSCSLEGAGLVASDFKKIPYMAVKGDYTNFSQPCQDSADAINAAGGKAQYVQFDQPGFWQGSYKGPYGADYVGPLAGVSHMMMIEDNPTKDRKNRKATNLQAMDVMLEWANRNISKPRPQRCEDQGRDTRHPHGHYHWHGKG